MKFVVPKLANIKIGDATLNIDALLNNDYEDVREASEKIPAAIAWLGWHRGTAVERLTIADQTWKEAEATVYFSLKSGGFIEKGYGDKMTEEALKKALVLDEKVRFAANEYAKAQRWVETFESTIKALIAKLDLVRTSEATRRRVMELPPENIERQRPQYYTHT